MEACPGEKTQAGKDLARLTAKAYLPRTEENRKTIELIESGILKEASVSCSVKRSVCSLCGEENCRHVPGSEYEGEIVHRILMDPTNAFECVLAAPSYGCGTEIAKIDEKTTIAGEEAPKDRLTKNTEGGWTFWGSLTDGTRILLGGPSEAELTRHHELPWDELEAVFPLNWTEELLEEVTVYQGGRKIFQGNVIKQTTKLGAEGITVKLVCKHRHRECLPLYGKE